MENRGRAQDSSAYLHQWQFPLSSPEAFRKLLSESPSENLPGLDDDLLDHCGWNDAVAGPLCNTYSWAASVTSISTTRGPGGLDLIIAPLVGWKEVTLSTETTRSSWELCARTRLKRSKEVTDSVR